MKKKKIAKVTKDPPVVSQMAEIIARDGKRYVVGVQDKEDKQCYKDKQELDHVGAAKETADAWAEREQRMAIVYDRHVGIIYHTMGKKE